MKEIPPLPKNTIMLVEVGSTAHGTGIQGGEDHDEMGIVVETAREVLGLTAGFKTVMQRTQPEGSRSGPGDTDRTLYSLRTFLHLTSAGNPSMLMSLWAPLIEWDHAGILLRDMSSAFIGAHIIPRYQGYMNSQAMRLLGFKGSSGHGKRGGGRREELIAEHGYDTKYAMHAARLGYQCIELLETDKLTLPIEGEAGQWLRDVRYGKVSFDEWWERVLWLDHVLENLKSSGDFRPGPDKKAIEDFSIRTHKAYWPNVNLFD